LVLVLAVNVLAGAMLVGLVLVADAAGRGDEGVALLNVAMGAGAVAGLVLTTWIDRPGRPARWLLVLTVVSGACLAPLAGVPWPGPAGLLFVAGAAGVLAEVLALTAVQRSVPQHEVARVFGILDSLLVGAVCLGSVVTPPLVDLVGLGLALGTLGLALTVGAGALSLVVTPPLRRTSLALEPAR
jgi:hypothetical protein